MSEQLDAPTVERHPDALRGIDMQEAPAPLCVGEEAQAESRKHFIKLITTAINAEDRARQRGSPIGGVLERHAVTGSMVPGDQLGEVRITQGGRYRQRSARHWDDLMREATARRLQEGFRALHAASNCL